MKEITIRDFIQTKVTYDSDGQYLWAVQENKHLQMLGEIRGWGHIQNMFNVKGEFLMDKAAQYQDELGKFVADAINEKIERDFKN